MLVPQPPVTQKLAVFGNKVFKELIEWKWAITVGSKPNMTGVLTRRERCQRCVCTGLIMTAWQSSKRVVVCMPQGDGHILWDLQPLELWESPFLLFKPLSLWHSGSQSWLMQSARWWWGQVYQEGQLVWGEIDGKELCTCSSSIKPVGKIKQSSADCQITDLCDVSWFVLFLKHFNSCLFPLNMPIHSFEIWCSNSLKFDLFFYSTLFLRILLFNKLLPIGVKVSERDVALKAFYVIVLNLLIIGIFLSHLVLYFTSCFKAFFRLSPCSFEIFL